MPGPLHFLPSYSLTKFLANANSKTGGAQQFAKAKSKRNGLKRKRARATLLSARSSLDAKNQLQILGPTCTPHTSQTSQRIGPNGSHQRHFSSSHQAWLGSNDIFRRWATKLVFKAWPRPLCIFARPFSWKSPKLLGP